MHFSNLQYEQAIKLIALSSVVSWGVTQIVKPFLKDALPDKEKSRSLIRVFAVISGMGVAATLNHTWESVWVGAAAGVLNAWTIAIIKAKLERKFEVKLPLTRTPPPQNNENNKKET